MRKEQALARLFLGYRKESPAGLVIFDHDSTLVDTEYAWREGTRKWLEGYGIVYDPQIRVMVTGKNQTEVTRIFKERYGLRASVEDLRKERLTIIMELFRKTAKPIQPVINLAKFLAEQGFYLAIASGAPIEFLQASIEMFSLQNVFQLVVSGDEVDRGKPSPDILFYTFAKVQEQHPDIKLNRCVVVEDSLNGVYAAKFAGTRCLLVPGVITQEQLEKAKQVLNSATDLVLSREELAQINYNDLLKEFQGAAVS